MSSRRYRLPRGSDWDTTPDIYSYSLSRWGVRNWLSGLWAAVCSAFASEAKKNKLELKQLTDARREALADSALQTLADGGRRPKCVQVVDGGVKCITVVVYSNSARYCSRGLFLHEDTAAAYLDSLAKEGARYDSRGKKSTTADLVLIDEDSDFTKELSKQTFGGSRFRALKTSYRVLLLQPFVKALANFEGDPLSDEALNWRMQFTVLVPYVAPPGMCSRPGAFMNRPDLRDKSARQEAERRAASSAARGIPLPPSGEDGL